MLYTCIYSGTGAKDVLYCFINQKDLIWRLDTLFSVESSFKYVLFHKKKKV